MKLFELTGVHKYYDKSLPEIFDALFRGDSRFTVSAGSYAFVLVPENKNYVYRVWTLDKGFEDFMRFIKSHSGPHVPKLIGSTRKIPMFFKRHKEGDHDMYVQRIEKLDEPDNQRLVEPVKYICRRFANMNEQQSKFEHTAEMVFDQVQHLYPGHADELKEFIDTVLEIKRANKWIDLRGQNFMFRDQVPVITDPWCKHVPETIKTASDVLASRNFLDSDRVSSGRSKKEQND